MRAVTLLLDGLPVSVYFYCETPCDISALVGEVGCGGVAVALYPERDADFGAICLDENGVLLKETYLPLMVLSYFFGAVRGLPGVSLDIVYNGNVYEMAVMREAQKFSVNLGKCKLICAKTIKFEDDVELSVDVTECGCVSASAVVYDSDLFDESHLRHLGALSGIGFSAPSLAVSYDGDLKIKCIGDIPFYSAVTIAVSTLIRRGIELTCGKTVARVNGIEHRISVENGRLIFYPNIKYLS